MNSSFNLIIPEQGIEDVTKQPLNNLNPGEAGLKMKTRKSEKKNCKQKSMISFFVAIMFVSLFTMNAFAASPQMVNLQLNQIEY